MGKLLTLVAFIVAGAAWLDSCSVTAAMEIEDVSRQRADSLIDWCATSSAVSLASLREANCHFEHLTGSGIARGMDRRAFWGRLALENPGSEAVERWISIGHPRLAQVSLFDETSPGPSRHDIGKRTPMSERGPIERAFDAMPVRLSPGESRVVWLRIWSDTPIDLTTTIWRPFDYIAAHQSTQYWVSLSLGGLFLAIIFSLMMLLITHELAYAYFSVCLSGALFNVGYVSGLVQRFLWPADWPLRSEYVAISVLIGILGYFGYMRTFFSKNSAHAQTYFLFKANVGITVVLLIYGIMIDYPSVLRLWNLSFVLVMALGAALSYFAWKRGDRAAGILCLSFVITLAWETLRLLVSLGLISWFFPAQVFGAWALTLSAAIALLSLMDRSREHLAQLAVIQAENETRLTFLAHMSHELRSPLDAILGNAQLMARWNQAASHPVRLASIFENGRHMLRLIDHILDYARGLAGVVKISPEPVSLASFLRKVERMARLHAAKQGNRFVLLTTPDPGYGDGVSLWLDANHLWRILDNLISNAARHTHDGVITLEVEVGLRASDHLRLDFQVSDTGEGIAAEHLQRIFQPFERGANQTVDGKGAGLGLAIARQLTELMGGRLGVESDAGQGASFSFWIIARMAPTDPETAMEDIEGFDATG